MTLGWAQEDFLANQHCPAGVRQLRPPLVSRTPHACSGFPGTADPEWPRPQNRCRTRTGFRGSCSPSAGQPVQLITRHAKLTRSIGLQGQSRKGRGRLAPLPVPAPRNACQLAARERLLSHPSPPSLRKAKGVPASGADALHVVLAAGALPACALQKQTC